MTTINTNVASSQSSHQQSHLYLDEMVSAHFVRSSQPINPLLPKPPQNAESVFLEIGSLGLVGQKIQEPLTFKYLVLEVYPSESHAKQT